MINGIILVPTLYFLFVLKDLQW